MARALRQLRMSRMIAAALSLAVLVASVVGAAAHAREHGHHGHHHGAGSISSDADRGALYAPVAEYIELLVIVDDEPQPITQHAGCLDFICHGGVAVPTTPWNVGSWPQAAVFPWRARSLVSMSPARLDRPPKSRVSA
jgi:hypothetical protein